MGDEARFFRKHSELVKKSETVARASLSVRDKAPYVKMGGV
jgi:hypothetical protein